jgi:hypothetical protein
MPHQYSYKRINHFRDCLAQRQNGLTDEETTFMRHDFQMILDRFDEVRGPRKNFLNYDYVIGKLAERHGLSANVTVRTFRSMGKMQEHELIWSGLSATLEPTPHERRRAAIKIQAWWRMQLAKRRRVRLLIGREIELLPDIGIAFIKARHRFMKAR